jgi:uncharacterized protein YqjF (DUF2071 family)
MITTVDTWRTKFRRHPLPMATTLRHSLVLSYAVPINILSPLCPPGLTLDTYGDDGFVAIAAVRAERLRPRGTPAFVGRDFLLTGYRIFVRHRNAEGRLLRGLHILRSDTNSRFMKLGGNLLTNYHYEHADISHVVTEDALSLRVASDDGVRLAVEADLTQPGVLPATSPFLGTNDARRYCGPLPWTIDFEAKTHSLVSVRGRRGEWSPRLVNVDVRTCTYFHRAEFAGYTPRLATAFYVDNIPYSWDSGIVTPIMSAPTTASSSDDPDDE